MISSIKKTFILVVYICLSFFTICTVHATTNLTSPNFTVELENIDPLNGTTNRISPPGGIDALKSILQKVSDIFLFTIPIIAVISLMIAGYFYIFSAGDSEKAGKAKTILKWNIVAMLVAFLSYGIVSIVASFFNP